MNDSYSILIIEDAKKYSGLHVQNIKGQWI